MHENHGSPDVLEYRRSLAVQRVEDGYPTQEVVNFFGVDARSVRRWVADARRHRAPGWPDQRAGPGVRGRLDLEPLPPHASALMPVEQIWAWLKYDRLCNFAPQDARHLERDVIRELEGITQDQERLRNFFHASDLPLPRTLLS